ncbi:MAG: carboxypeptidase regulatory-like domain-containing protein [Erysipelotrichaceae bacterium]|nr:carboxypeptidase regulatory-like domain-containing protein [Erysipelotrichaceae bacterium]
MANYVAYNASHHYVGMGIKGDALDEEKYAKYMVSMRTKDFESGNNIETETDEGHTGGANLNMGKYRTTAESEPAWTDKLRFKEGLEDIWLLLLGNYAKNPTSSRFDYGTGVEGVNHFYFDFPPIEAKEPPACTVYNGYAKTTDDARVFNNSFLSELEVTHSNEEAPTINPKFVSDYNDFNLANPTRNYLAQSTFVKPKQVNIYYGDPELTLEQLWEKKLGCFMESSYTFNKNYEQVPCQDNKFGRTSKYMGEWETTGSFKVPWNDKTRKLEPEYEGGTTISHSVTEEIIEKQIAYEYIGTIIGETEINYKMIVHFPLIELTKAESPLSGNDVKDLTIEYDVPTKPEHSFVYVDLWTDLGDLHIDNEGCNLSDLFYDENASTDETPSAFTVGFAVTSGGNPVEGATVTIGSETQTTDASGQASFANIPSGTVSYTVAKSGYATVTDTASVTQNTTVDVTLNEE